ncbi:unnamed protein product [Strongylus vulgaris]|uniref:Uncharacterized protein n=1 Tax=Strongylus vulgaris TaxID=40348 RepID=A0A3P7ITS4_STRVU|nr:unnamed protein product [Strongylus vulgaris]
MKTLGGELHCNPDMMKPSVEVPDDVNNVRPADLKVIAAMGDSITVSLMDDWKIVTIFIGTNDLEKLRCNTEEEPVSRDDYKLNLIQTISILRENLNRTIVSIVSMWNSQLVLDAKSLIDDGLVIHSLCELILGPTA